MIDLTTPTSNGIIRHCVAPATISRITQAGPSGQWHGIRAYVRLFDGSTLDVCESVDEIKRALDAARKEAGRV